MWESSGWILPTVLYAPRFAGWDDVGDTLCPIARSLSVIGDRWTMLLIRELLFGTKRFDEFQAQTGMSSHLLSTLLTRLEEEGVVKRTPYQDRPVRYDCRLTEKGKDLFPVIRSARTGTPPSASKKGCETTPTGFGFTWLSAAHHAHLRLDL